MKIKILTVLLFASLVCPYFPAHTAYAFTKEPLQQQSPQRYQDIISSLLMPHILKSVGEYYSKFLTEGPLVDPWDVKYLSVERPDTSFKFVVKIQVIPYVGPHIDVGTDVITVTVEGTGEVTINKFEHLKSSYLDLPDNWQHIIKRT